MENKFKFLLQLAFVMICSCCMSCNDLIDKDLTNEQLQIDNPVDSFVANNYNIVFLWEPVKGTSSYHIQIAQPNFTNLQQLLVDSVVIGTKFTCSLFPGVYQWRIRAENGSTNSGYITRTLTVDSNSNLNGQTFVTLTPVNNFITNTSVVYFSWAAFPYADSYEYVLTDANNNILHTKYTGALSVADTIPEGTYTWKAKAFNSSNATATAFSAASNITIDLTAPDAPIPQSPAYNSLDSNVVTLSWTQPVDAYADSVIVAKDSVFQNIVFNKYLAGSLSCILNPLTTNLTYYWRLRSRDIAGNWSVYSPVYKFYLQ